MDRLLKPWSLGGMNIRNRLVMAPVKTAYGTPDGPPIPRPCPRV